MLIEIVTKQKTRLLPSNKYISTIQFGIKIALPASLLITGDHVLVGYYGIHPRKVWESGGILQICPIKSINKIRN